MNPQSRATTELIDPAVELVHRVFFHPTPADSWDKLWIASRRGRQRMPLMTTAQLASLFGVTSDVAADHIDLLGPASDECPKGRGLVIIHDRPRKNRPRALWDIELLDPVCLHSEQLKRREQSPQLEWDFEQRELAAGNGSPATPPDGSGTEASGVDPRSQQIVALGSAAVRATRDAAWLEPAFAEKSPAISRQPPSLEERRILSLSSFPSERGLGETNDCRENAGDLSSHEVAAWSQTIAAERDVRIAERMAWIRRQIDDAAFEQNIDWALRAVSLAVDRPSHHGDSGETFGQTIEAAVRWARRQSPEVSLSACFNGALRRMFRRVHSIDLTIKVI